MIDYQAILEEIYDGLKLEKDKGKVATYIPELSNVDINNFGIYLNQINGENYSIGNYDTAFSIQSISKVLTLTKAFSLLGDDLWKRVDVEPSGNPFNQLSLLEFENGIPRNPLINSGAIVIADILVSQLKNPKEEFLTFVRNITNDDSICYDENVAKSEKETGFKNYAAANLLKSFKNLNNSVD